MGFAIGGQGEALLARWDSWIGECPGRDSCRATCGPHRVMVEAAFLHGVLTRLCRNLATEAGITPPREEWVVTFSSDLKVRLRRQKVKPPQGT